MSSVVFLNISGLMYTILIAMCFFIKKKVKNVENKLYSYIIISTLAESIFGLVSYFSIQYKFPEILNIIIGKGYLISMIAWTMIFTLYIIEISKQMKDKPKKIFQKIITASCVICALLIAVLSTSLAVFVAEDYTVQSGDYLKKIAKQIYGDEGEVGSDL